MRFRLLGLRTSVLFFLVLIAGVAALGGQQTAPVSTGIKYMRDSEEYATLARQVYRQAGEAVSRAVTGAAPRNWAVVLDVDETSLDNSTYQLERATYNLPYDPESWSAWVSRREAAAVPGAVEFVTAVRRARGRVAWITNRDGRALESTKLNLDTAGLWNVADKLCMQDTAARTKRLRRGEVISGEGDCAWAGQPMQVVAFVGDQLGDFPEADEKVPGTGTDTAFGRTCFLLPNSMYGNWTTKVTRTR